MRNKLTFIFLAGMSTFVQANDYTAKKLTEINAETTVLEAMLKREEVRKQLNLARSDPDAAVKGNARVVWVEGFGTAYSARLQMPSGSLTDVKVGDRLSDGSLVKEIKANRVVVVQDGRPTLLEFIDRRSTSSSATLK